MAAPAVTRLRYKVLSPGMLTDEKAATLALYEKAAERARRQGQAMASDPAVVALCEKQLVGFLRHFLQQQPGVKVKVKEARKWLLIHGHRRLAAAQAAGYPVLLVGDEPYFSRFGFSAAPCKGVRMPGPVNQRRVLARGVDLLDGPVTA